MQSLQEIRRRTENAQELRSLVRTMKTIAAVNIRHYERSVSALADYNRTTEMGLQVLLRERRYSLPSPEREAGEGVAIVVFGSSQGMCGQFNEQIASYTLARLNDLGLRAQVRIVLAVGSRTAARLEDAGQPVDQVLPGPHSLAGVTPSVHQVLWLMEDWQARGRANRVELFYNRLLSGSAWEPCMVHLWPIDPQRFSSLEARTWPSRSLPTFSMSWEALFSALLRQHLFVSLYRAFSESLASESASRLASMQVAERNIDEKLEELEALYHRQRQGGITGELLDIISGFEVLTES